MKTLHQKIIAVTRMIPPSSVATYGMIAAVAGSPRGARQVVRALHNSSEKEELPWHRVVNREGRISLPPGNGHELQKALLEEEGVVFDHTGRIDLERYLWRP